MEITGVECRGGVGVGVDGVVGWMGWLDGWGGLGGWVEWWGLGEAKRMAICVGVFDGKNEK